MSFLIIRVDLEDPPQSNSLYGNPRHQARGPGTFAGPLLHLYQFLPEEILKPANEFFGPFLRLSCLALNESSLMNSVELKTQLNFTYAAEG